MLSTIERRWAILAMLSLLALVAVATAVGGETHTWEGEAGLEAGDWDNVVWDPEAGGITMSGTSSFWKYRGNAVVPEGAASAWDDEGVLEPCVVFAKGQYYLYYTGYDGSDYAIGLARSTDGKSFSKYGTSARVSKGTSGTYDGSGCREPTVLYEDGLFKMWYTGVNGAAESIAYATSKDGLTWVKYGSNPVLSQPSSGWGSNEFGDPYVVRADGRYYMYLSGSASLNNKLLGVATSKDGTSWTLHSSNPIVSKAPTGAFGRQEICDAAVVKDGPVFRMYFSGRNTASDKFKIGYGESFDGYDWTLSKSIYVGLGASGTFDSTELSSPGAIIGDGGAIHMYYQGNDGTDTEVGTATSMPWLVRPNPPSDKILGTGSTYDATHLQDPCVLLPPSGVYTMFYGCYGGASYPYAIAKATSNNPNTGWSKYASSPVLSRGSSGAWDDDRLAAPCVIYEHGVYKMWFAGYDGSVWKIGYATSTDGNTWTKYGSNPVLSGTTGKWDASGVTQPWVMKVGQTYHMWYVGWTSTSGRTIGHATSTNGTSWTKDSASPVFVPEPTHTWEEDHVENPCVIWDKGRYVMYYNGRYTTNKGRIGLAYSADGGNWTRDPLNPYIDWGNSTQFSDDGVAMGSVLQVGAYKHIYYAGYSGSNWELGYATQGAERATYTTPPLDASSVWPVAWGTLTWDADTPLGTGLRFQVATNQGGTIWRFVGPDGTKDTYFTENGQGAHWYQSGKYMRVRAYLTTDDSSKFVPMLRSMTMTYGPRSGVSPPTVTVTSPNGGEDWMKTKTYPITWEARGNLNDTSVDLAYSLDNGTTWTDIATRKPNTGFYKWTVPSTETSGALIKVTILDIDNMMAWDTSDATFAIDPPAPKAGEFHSPSAGETLGPGPTTLSWTVEDPWGLTDAPLTLELSTDGGSSWSTVAEGLPLTDGIEWDVPSLSASSDACRLRLSVRSWLGDVSAIESGEFSIDVSPPSVSWYSVPESIVEGETYRVEVEAVDDLGDLNVVLHVTGPVGERTYAMTSETDGIWSADLEARLDDEAIWATAHDGIGSVETTVRGLTIASATDGAEEGTASLAAELVLATALAVIVVVVVAMLVGRRR